MPEFDYRCEVCGCIHISIANYGEKVSLICQYCGQYRPHKKIYHPQAHVIRGGGTRCGV